MSNHPLYQLTLVRFREFLREPEALFWVFGFPLLLAAGLVALVLKLSTRRELIRLEAKYERIRNESGSGNEHKVPSPDGGAAARSRGGPGVPAHQRSAAARG